MRQNKKNNYQSPVIEVYEIEIEQGFAGSSGTSNLEDLSEKGPIGW